MENKFKLLVIWLLQLESKYHMSHGLSWKALHLIGDAHANNIVLDWFWIFFLGHTVYFCSHMHNDQISCSNEIVFLTYQTCDHMVDYGSDFVLYQQYL